MNLNDNFTKRVVMHGDSLAWEASPMKEVDRRRLDHIDADNDRATYAIFDRKSSSRANYSANFQNIPTT